MALRQSSGEIDLEDGGRHSAPHRQGFRGWETHEKRRGRVSRLLAILFRASIAIIALSLFLVWLLSRFACYVVSHVIAARGRLGGTTSASRMHPR